MDTIISSKKIDDKTAELEFQEPTPAPIKVRYTREELEKQLTNIQAMQDADNALREAEKNEVKALLEELDKLRIK